MNLAHILESRAAESPDARGLLFEDGRSWTFGELNAAASHAAMELGGAGSHQGQRIGLYVPTGPEFIILLFAIWKTGATAATINYGYRDADLGHALELSAPSVVLTDGCRSAAAIETTAGRTVLDIAQPGGIGDAITNTRDDGVALTSPDVLADAESTIIFTGGSTGKPKAVARLHKGEYESIATLARNGMRGATEPYPAASPATPPNLVCLPLAHAGGQKSTLFSFHVGRTVLLLSRFEVGKVVELIKQYRVTNLTLMPTMMHDLSGFPGGADLSSVRSVLATGQELRPAVRMKFEERFGIPIVSNYGSTEAGTIASWSRSDIRAGKWKPGSVGKLLPGVAVEIRGEDRKPLPPGEVGEICVASTMATRYVGEDAGEGSLLENGWVNTGDVGWLDEDDVLFLTGRVRELIKCGGLQVWPTELEEVVLSHPQVNDAAVIGRPDDRLGEVPVAYVVPREGSGITRDELIAYCRDRVAHYKAIRDAVLVEALPRTDVGKLAKSTLVEWDLRNSTAGGVADGGHE